MNLRKRIAGSRWANEFAAAVLYRYIRFCHATTRWDRVGFEELSELLRAEQPVIILVWHERLFMSTYLFDTNLGKVCAITTQSRMAELGQRLLRRFKFDSVMIEPKANPIVLTREIFRRIRRGESVVISPDGTRGPARVAKSFPIVWARSTQIPVFCAAYSVRRSMRLPTWDRPHIVLPFNRGVFLLRRWEETVPRNATEEQMERLREMVSDKLNAVTDEADEHIGRPPTDQSGRG